MLSTQPSQNSTRSVQIPVQQRANFLCMTSFCDWDKNEDAPPDIDVFEQVGQRLGQIILVYEGGVEKSFPVRRRFEVNAPLGSWGHFCYSCVAWRDEAPRELTDPLANAEDWGRASNGCYTKFLSTAPGYAPYRILIPSVSSRQ